MHTCSKGGKRASNFYFTVGTPPRPTCIRAARGANAQATSILQWGLLPDPHAYVQQGGQTRKQLLFYSGDSSPTHMHTCSKGGKRASNFYFTVGTPPRPTCIR